MKKAIKFLKNAFCITGRSPPLIYKAITFSFVSSCKFRPPFFASCGYININPYPVALPGGVVRGPGQRGRAAVVVEQRALRTCRCLCRSAGMAPIGGDIGSSTTPFRPLLRPFPLYNEGENGVVDVARQTRVRTFGSAESGSGPTDMSRAFPACAVLGWHVARHAGAADGFPTASLHVMRVIILPGLSRMGS